jgi:hypothetical protein
MEFTLLTSRYGDRMVLTLKLSGTLALGSAGNADCVSARTALLEKIKAQDQRFDTYVLDVDQLKYTSGNGITDLYVIPRAHNLSTFILAHAETKKRTAQKVDGGKRRV